MNHMDNPAIRNILGRRSIRKYTDNAVAPEALDAILECASAYPSANGGMPAHFITITDRSRLTAIAEAHPYGKMLAHAPLAIAVCGDPTKNASTATYWEEDCAAAMENILLAASAIGLGAVWLGVYPSEERESAIKQILGVPPHIKLMGIASIGHPAEEKEPRGEKSPVHSEVW